MLEKENKDFPQESPELLPIFRAMLCEKWLSVYRIKGTQSPNCFRLYWDDSPEPLEDSCNLLEVVAVFSEIIGGDSTPLVYEVHSKEIEGELEKIKIDRTMRIFLKNDDIFKELSQVSSAEHAQHVLDEKTSKDCKFCQAPAVNN